MNNLHFHDQEAYLLINISAKNLFVIVVLAIVSAIGYTSAHAEGKTNLRNELQLCQTIAVVTIENNILVNDSYDDLTLTLSKGESIKRALSSMNDNKFSFQNIKGNCRVELQK